MDDFVSFSEDSAVPLCPICGAASELASQFRLQNVFFSPLRICHPSALKWFCHKFQWVISFQ